MAGTDTLTVKISRFNPSIDEKPYFDTYQVPYEEGRSILGLLKFVYENLDSSLAFYWSCRIGKCRGCHIRVNGKTCLACTTVVHDRDLVIEPMPGYRVVRDLVVDRTRSGGGRIDSHQEEKAELVADDG